MNVHYLRFGLSSVARSNVDTASTVIYVLRWPVKVSTLKNELLKLKIALLSKIL